MLGKNSTSNVEYVITKCQFYVAEDNYEQGELNDTDWSDYDVTFEKSNTLEDLLKSFVENECYGHKFDLEDFVYDPEYPGRIELSVMGKLIANNTIDFIEPSAKDFEDFKKGKINLSSFIFDLYVEKRLKETNLIDEFEKLGIGSM